MRAATYTIKDPHYASPVQTPRPRNTHTTMRDITINDFVLRGDYYIAKVQDFDDNGKFIERKAFISKTESPEAFAKVAAHQKKSS